MIVICYLLFTAKDKIIVFAYKRWLWNYISVSRVTNTFGLYLEVCYLLSETPISVTGLFSLSHICDSTCCNLFCSTPMMPVAGEDLGF